MSLTVEIVPETLLFVRHHDECDIPQCVFVRVQSILTHESPNWVIASIVGRLQVHERCFRGSGESQDLGKGTLVHLANITIPDHPAVVRRDAKGVVWNVELRQPTDALGLDLMRKAIVTAVPSQEA